MAEDNMHRRTFLIGTAAALAVCPSFAQDAFPSHAITILNAFPPGGANDLVTRPLASAMEPILKVPVVVETKAGAGGQVGAQVAATSKPDGYTLLSHNNGISGYAEVDKLFGRQPKTTRDDFIPLARLVADPVLLLVNTQQQYKTLADFVAAAKKSPETIIYSSGGLYRATHLPVALFEKATGIGKMRHLPTNGGGPAITALLGNNAQMSMQSTSASLSHIKSGQRTPRRADDEGARIRYGVFLLGRHFRTERHARARRGQARRHHRPGRSLRAASRRDRKSGQELAYLNTADFAKFWDQDAKHADEAVHLIGLVQG
jgi:tripartite-type tricarboxylate transporter receptor subunit TctC